nr:sigma-70 family RNA polymerase sigma factor [Polyangium aurulentum]
MKYIPIVVARLKKIGVREADIKDITQKVFLKVHSYFEQVPAEGVEAWLFIICEQQAASHYRPLCERRERPEPYVDFPMDDEDDQYERLELAQFMSQALKEIDPQLADILVRHEVDEQTLPVIARELGISRNTAQARLADAKKALKRKMVQLLRPVTPRNRRRLMLLPFGLGAFFHDDKPLSPEFMEEVRRDVWQRLARELGYPEELPPAPSPSPEPPPSEPPSSQGIEAKDEPSPPSSRRLKEAAKKLLERILTNPLFWSVPSLVAGYMLRPPPQHEPASRLRMPTIVLPVVLAGEGTQGQTTTDSAPASSGVRNSTARATTVILVPHLDGDMERKDLAQAREGLRGRRFAEVLAAMNEHGRKYPKSPYAALREGYIVQALVGLGRVEEARERAAALRDQHPGDEIVDAHDELLQQQAPAADEKR